MNGGVRHPRALALFRLVLYATAIAVLVAVTMPLVGYLGFLVAVGGVAVLLNVDANLLALAAVGGVSVALVGTLGGIVVTAARRFDRRVTELDRKPDPLESLKQRYVDADIDEHELERRLERLLDDTRDRRDGSVSLDRLFGGGSRDPDRVTEPE